MNKQEREWLEKTLKNKDANPEDILQAVKEKFKISESRNCKFEGSIVSDLPTGILCEKFTEFLLSIAPEDMEDPNVNAMVGELPVQLKKKETGKDIVITFKTSEMDLEEGDLTIIKEALETADFAKFVRDSMYYSGFVSVSKSNRIDKALKNSLPKKRTVEIINN